MFFEISHTTYMQKQEDWKPTWVNVVRCRLLAGVGQDAVVGVCPAWWGNDDIPLPGDETPPDNDDKPEFGSGFSFLNAPSAEDKTNINCYWIMHLLILMLLNFP